MVQSRLKTIYQETIVVKLKQQFNYTNVHQVPKVLKVNINRGLGEASQNAKALESSIREFESQLLPVLKQQSQVSRFVKECQ